METHLARQADLRLQEVTELLNASLGPLMAAQDYGSIAEFFAPAGATTASILCPARLARPGTGQRRLDSDQACPPPGELRPGPGGPASTPDPRHPGRPGMGLPGLGISTEFIAEPARLRPRQPAHRPRRHASLRCRADPGRLLADPPLRRLGGRQQRPFRPAIWMPRAGRNAGTNGPGGPGLQPHGRRTQAPDRRPAGFGGAFAAFSISPPTGTGNRDADFRFTLHRAGRLALPGSTHRARARKCRWELPNDLVGGRMGGPSGHPRSPPHLPPVRIRLDRHRRHRPPFFRQRRAGLRRRREFIGYRGTSRKSPNANGPSCRCALPPTSSPGARGHRHHRRRLAHCRRQPGMALELTGLHPRRPGRHRPPGLAGRSGGTPIFLEAALPPWWKTGTGGRRNPGPAQERRKFSRAGHGQRRACRRETPAITS